MRAMEGCVDSEGKYLDVRFLAEPAIDEGGLTREFLLTLMVCIWMVLLVIVFQDTTLLQFRYS